MFASHRDACILAKYASDLGAALEAEYEHKRLGKSVIAYRTLGKSNYHFAADAILFAESAAPCIVLCFDISGFFDNLDHRLLKRRICDLLGFSSLPADWYQVFKHVTKFRKIMLSDIAAHAVLGPRLKELRRIRKMKKSSQPQRIATIAEIKDAHINISRNANSFGIPQGTPISSVLSNLYLVDFDTKILDACRARKALYQRYSDDIIVICPPDAEADLKNMIIDEMQREKLEIKEEKTTRSEFIAGGNSVFQYLGFDISNQRSLIRGSSLSRQWRKAKHSLRVTRDIGLEKIRSGKASKIHTKRLRRRFQPVGARNFSAYARRAAKAFGSRSIVRQVLRLERFVHQEIRAMEYEAEILID